MIRRKETAKIYIDIIVKFCFSVKKMGTDKILGPEYGRSFFVPSRRFPGTFTGKEGLRMPKDNLRDRK